jgi:hypothetical protein
MPASFVQSATSTLAGGTTTTATFANPAKVGNFVIVSFWFALPSADSGPPVITDTYNNSFIMATLGNVFVPGSESTTPVYLYAGVAYAVTTTSGPGQAVTIVWDTAEVNFVTISEWNNLEGLEDAVFAGVNVAAGTPTAAPTVGPVTPPSDGELVYCMFVSDGLNYSGNPAAGAGFNLIQSVYYPNFAWGDEYVIQSAEAPVTGTFEAGGVFASPTGYVAVIVTFTSNGPPASGTLMERSFACNGCFESTSAYGDVLKSLALSMAGFVVPPGDCWRVYAGSYVPPTVTLQDIDCRAAIKGDFRLSSRDTCNGVKGQYIPEFLPINPLGPLSSSPANSAWKKTDFPPVQRANYIEEDGGIILWKDIQLDFTISLWMAQRIARIVLERLRRQVTVSLPAKLTGLALLAADTVEFLHARWNTAVPPPPTTFQISHTALRMESQADGVPGFGVDLVLRQTDAEVYEFDPPTSPTNWGSYSGYGQTGVGEGNVE